MGKPSYFENLAKAPILAKQFFRHVSSVGLIFTSDRLVHVVMHYYWSLFCNRLIRFSKKRKGRLALL